MLFMGSRQDCAVQLDVWGNMRAEHNLGKLYQPIRLPGQHVDGELGLYYNRHRYYVADAGIYINEDPLGLSGGVNSYIYPNSLLTNIDPVGLRTIGPVAPGAYYPRGQAPTPLARSNLPRAAAYEAAASMTQTPNPAYPGDPLDLPCIEWDCSDKDALTCKPNDIKKPHDFIPPAVTTADPPKGCKCITAGRDPAFQLPFDPKLDSYSNAYDVKDNWKKGIRLLRR